MAALVQIPWQPYLWLTPSTLALLKEASRIRGHNIMLNGQDAAWRSYERQDYLWDINGHNAAKANDPDRGQRSHMRGAAVDGPTDARTRQAFKDAGFLPDANEPWHWNDPHWPFMPIIKTNTAAAGGGSTPIEEDDMYTDADRVRDNAIATQVKAVYDAVFTTSPTSRGSLGILAELKKLDDALFKTDTTSFGTPGGVLKTLRTVTDKLGITKP